ncbi:MAG TPA: hypothetical protein VIU11_24845 [Nakamurella sp.]
MTGLGTAEVARQPVEQLVTAGAEIGQLRSGVGLLARYAPARDVAPFDLAMQASVAALDDAGASAADIDLVLQVGRMRVDYFTWGLSLALAKELGRETVRCLDVTEFTGPSLIAGLRLLAAKFAVDDRVDTALLVFPHRFSDVVDIRDAGDQWLWPISDGAGALVVHRGPGVGSSLGYAAASAGTAGRAIGLRTEVVDDGPEPDGFFDHEWALARYYFVRDPAGWPEAFRQSAVTGLSRVIRAAVGRAGLDLADIVRVQTGFLYPGVADELGRQLALGDRLRPYNDHGYLGGAELVYPLREMIVDPSLRGRVVVQAGFSLPGGFSALVQQL